MKRILFFVNSLRKGGAEKVCINLGNWYRENGYIVDYIVLFNHNLDDNITNGHIFCLNLDSNISKLKLIRQIKKKVKKINNFITEQEKTGNYDLITAHLPLSHICANSSIVKKKCLYVQHTSLYLYNKKMRYAYKWFYKKKMNICVSDGLKTECIEKMNFNPLTTKTIYNPINSEHIKNIDSNSDNKYKPYFLCVGRLAKEKRFDRAIEIFYKGRFYEKFKLIFLGTGELEAQLKSQVEGLGIKKSVYFLGWKKDVYVWMKNAELVLQTSEREALSMSLIEALACGTRVVASDCEFGANEILRDDLNKFIAHQDDIDDYIQKINRALISFPLENEYKIVELCQDSVICHKYLKIYKELFRKDL